MRTAQTQRSVEVVNGGICTKFLSFNGDWCKTAQVHLDLSFCRLFMPFQTSSRLMHVQRALVLYFQLYCHFKH